MFTPDIYFPDGRPLEDLQHGVPNLNEALRCALHRAPIALSPTGLLPASAAASLSADFGTTPAGGWSRLLPLTRGLYFDTVGTQYCALIAPQDLPACGPTVAAALLTGPTTRTPPQLLRAQLLTAFHLRPTCLHSSTPAVVRSLISGSFQALFSHLLECLGLLSAHQTYTLAGLAALLRDHIRIYRTTLHSDLACLAPGAPTHKAPERSSAYWRTFALDFLEHWLIPAGALVLTTPNRFALLTPSAVTTALEQQETLQPPRA